MSDYDNDDDWKWNDDGVSNSRKLASVSIQIPFIFVVFLVILCVVCACCAPGRQQAGGEGRRTHAGQGIGVSPSNAVSTGIPNKGVVAVPIGYENGRRRVAEGQGGGVSRGGEFETGRVYGQHEESSDEC